MDRETIAKRRAIEDAAMALGEERAEIKNRLTENTERIIELLQSAAHHFPLEHFGRLTGVGRATLYRWLDVDQQDQDS
jgi:hypothetical protein